VPWQQVATGTSFTTRPNLPELDPSSRYKMVIDLTANAPDWVFDSFISTISGLLWPFPIVATVFRENSSIVIEWVAKT